MKNLLASLLLIAACGSPLPEDASTEQPQLPDAGVVAHRFGAGLPLPPLQWCYPDAAHCFTAFKVVANGTGASCSGSGSTQTCTFAGSGGTAVADAPITGDGSSGSHLACATCTTLAGTQELTNKTLTAPLMKNGLTASGSVNYDFSGSTGGFKLPTGTLTMGSATISLVTGTTMTDGGTLTLKSTVATGSNGVVINGENLVNDPIVMFQQAHVNQFYIKAFGTHARIGVDSGKTALEIISGGGNQLITIQDQPTQEIDICQGASCVVATTNHFQPIVDTGATGHMALGGASKRFDYAAIGGAAAVQPTCDATFRGSTMTIFAANGASDTFQVCMKSAADAYAWRTVFTAP